MAHATESGRKHGTGPGHVSGVVILDQLTLSRELLGDDVVTRAFGAISAEQRAELDELLPVSWCRLTTAFAIHEAIAEQIEQDVLVWHRTIVRVGIERTLTTVWRLFMRLTSTEALLKRAASIYGKSYDRGAVRAAQLPGGGVEVVLTEWPDVPDFELDAMATGLDAILRLGGRKNTHVAVERRSGGARFVVRVR
ncbi:MAG TPA: hypothetical protein VIY73_06840 [Polyangiaceae bacterium]